MRHLVYNWRLGPNTAMFQLPFLAMVDFIYEDPWLILPTMGEESHRHHLTTSSSQYRRIQSKW